MNGLEVWLLITIIPNLPNLIVSICVFLLCSLGLYWCIYLMKCCILNDEVSLHSVRGSEHLVEDKKTEFNEYRKTGFLKGISYNKKCIVILLLLLFTSTTVPTRQELAAIILIPYVTHNKEFKQIPKNVMHKLNEYLTIKDK
jgi:hypothetical protein